MKLVKAKTERIKKLRETITYHQKRYHEEDAPEISDEAYDSLLRELRDLEGSSDESSDSITNVFGGAPSVAFSKVKHQVKQWSLSNVFSETELSDWITRIKRHLLDQDVKINPSFVIEHKLDGLKVVLEYQKGQLIRAATRGDGTTGEDVTHTAKVIKAIPQTLTSPVSIICVGEVILTEANFHKINEERAKAGEPLFANPRNAAAGSLRQLDPEVTKKRRLSVVMYDVDAFDALKSELKLPKSQLEELELLRILGFNISKYNHQGKTVTDIVGYYKTWQKKRASLPYGIDGVVVKVDDIQTQKLLGFTAKSPRFGVAFKFPAEQTTTVIEDIVLQVGRTGVITPVAHLSPTLIDGSTVSRATLHNEDQIKRLDIRIGDTVILQKAGDVIPEVVAVVHSLRPKKTKPFRFPKKVAECGGAGSIERVPGEAAYRCVVNDSDFLHRQRLYYFVSKHALNIDGVGPKIIDLLLDEGLINEASDLFTLEIGDLKNLPGFKEKAAQNVITAIEKARHVTLPNLLIALSIEHIGEETARLIADYSGSIDKIKTTSLEELIAIHGVGEVVARSLVSWFKQKPNCQHLDALLPHLQIILPEKRATKTALSGKTLVFTGVLTTYSREEAKDLARLAGATVTNSVSKKTDYVVAGSEAGSKAKTAEILGVKIISEAEFLKMTS